MIVRSRYGRQSLIDLGEGGFRGGAQSLIDGGAQSLIDGGAQSLIDGGGGTITYIWGWGHNHL